MFYCNRILVTLALLGAGLMLCAGQRADARAVNSSTIYANSFDNQADINYDTWPDHWHRATSIAYPHYTSVAIHSDASAENGRCLQMRLDGGGARIDSPAIPILPKFGYKLIARVRGKHLRHTRPTIFVELQNRQGERVQVEATEPLSASGEWVEVEIGPFHPSREEIDRAIIVIDAPRGKRGDLSGQFEIDQVLLERLPSMKITTGRACNVYDKLTDIEVECTLSGIRDQNPEIRFQLLDAATSREIAGKSTTQELHGRLISEDSLNARDITVAAGNYTRGYEGSTVWKPQIDDYGFYKIRVEMLRELSAESTEEMSDYDRQLEERIITLAVLPELPRSSAGEFGWSLPAADNPLSFDMLTQLLPRAGVHWVKMPVWYEADDRARGEAIVRFAERLSSSGIELVGVLDNPMDDYRLRDPTTPSNIANILLADPSFWQPKFEHIMTRLSLRLRWWQLGSDGDTSFYGYPDLSEKLLSIRKHLFRFGQDVKLGLGWRWPHKTDIDPWSPPVKNPTWDYEQMSAEPGLSATELEAHMSSIPNTSALRWVLVTPDVGQRHDAPMHNETSPNQTATLETAAVENAAIDEPAGEQRAHDDRVREFVQQMVTAKMHGAQGVFVANPFSGPKGVMKLDGTPGELFLPWRTTAHLLGGCTYLGHIQLPNDSTNQIFATRDDQIVMIVWNDEPTTERLYLGESIHIVDVWGKQQAFNVDAEGRVELEVDRRPRFVLGMNRAIAEWRMSIEFDQLRIPSVFSRVHPNIIRGHNPFRQAVTARYSIHAPTSATHIAQGTALPGARNTDWDILPRRGDLAIGSNQPFELPIRIELSEATYGPQPIRIDFDVDGDRPYKFSAWRQLYVGLGDIQISIQSRLDDQGALIVEQRMVNTGPDTADFKCLLYAPPRRRKRTQVVMLGPDGNTKTYKYSNAEELLGQVLKLRAEQIDGSRVLVYRFIAGEKPSPPAKVSSPQSTVPASAAAVQLPTTKTPTTAAPTTVAPVGASVRGDEAPQPTATNSG